MTDSAQFGSAYTGAPDQPAAPPAAPTSGGFGSFLGNLGFGSNYTPADPAASPLDQAADMLQQRVQRANKIATNPLAALFAPEQVQAARDFVPKATEQLQTIQKQKADIAAGRKQADMLGLDPGEVSDQATREDRVTAAQQRALKGDLKAFQGLQAVSPKDAEAIQDQVHAAVASNLDSAQSGFDKLSNARNQGEYTAALRELRQKGSISGLESLGLKVPDKYEQFSAVKGREAEALRQARIGIDSVRQKLEDRNTYQPMEEKEAKTYSGRLTTAYGDQVTNGTWSRNGAAGTRGLVVNGAANPKGLGRDFTLATPEQRKAIEEESEKSVPKDEREKGRNFNRTYKLATTDAKGNRLPDGQVNTNPNVQQGMAEGLASMLRGGSGGANVGLLKIETNKRGFIQGLVDKISTEKAAVINELKGADVNPYLSKLTQGQIRDVMDVLKQYNDTSVGGRNEPIARRAGALGLDAAALGYAKGENANIDAALEEGRQAQINRMLPYHQAIGGGDGVFQIGAQRPGVGATNMPGQPTTQLSGARPLLTPVQQANNPPVPGAPDAPSPSNGGPLPPGSAVAGGPGGSTPANIPPNYIADIKKTEGFSAIPKWDYKQFSSGYGTRAAHSAEVIDRETADRRFNDEIGKAAAVVDKVNPNLDPGTRAALASLTFNSGEKWVQSGLGEKVRAGDIEGAKAAFLQYNKAGGEKNSGLETRRIREARWFGQGTTDQNTPADVGRDTPQEQPPGRGTRAERMAALGRDVSTMTPADMGRDVAGVAPTALGTAGMFGGAAVGGPVGAAAGSGVGAAAGQSLKDWLLGNAQSPARIAKEGALGAVLGVAPEGRPLVGAAARALGAGAVEGGTKALEGGDAVDAGEAAFEGAGAAAAGEGFGRALGMGLHKLYSLFTPSAQKAVRAAAADLHTANETLKTEQPKLPGVAGAAATANPKYEAAAAAKDAAELRIKEMMPNAKPDEVAYAHKVTAPGDVPHGEAAVKRPGELERERLGAGYRQLETEVGQTGVGAPKAQPKLKDGPIAAAVGMPKKTQDIAERTERVITAAANNWQEKWIQLKDARSALLDAERDALTSTAAGRTQTAKDMRTLADSVRKQQEGAANAVFGPVKGPEIINRLKMLDTRYARLMDATNNGDMLAAAKLKGEAGRNADRAFRAFAQDDRVALAAWDAMRRAGPDVEKDIRTLVGVEKIPVLGHVVSAVKLAAGYNQWRAERAAGSPARFEDFVPELKEAMARHGRTVRDLGGTIGARAGVSISENGI